MKNEKKHRRDDDHMKKSVAATIITVLSIASIISTVAAVSNARKVNDTERNIATNYRHAFSEIVNGVSELDSALQKSLLVTSPSMAGMVCTEVYATAQTTSMALGVMPFSSTEFERTTSFINTVGDYAFALSQKAARGEEFSQEDKEGLKALSETATKLSQTFRDLEYQMGSQVVGIEQYERTLKEYEDQEEEFIPETLADSVNMAEMEFPEIPTLIYDGPFSEHLKDSSPKLLEGKEEITEAEGRRSVADFLGVRAEQVYPTGQREGKLPEFCYGTEINGAQLSISVTKVGGVVTNVLSSRPVENASLTAKEAMDAAKKMLERWGYTDMKDSYYIIHNNVLTTNFAYEQDGVICYPDLIKVSIAMDNGTLHGFEATGYVSSHYQRDIPEAELSFDEARERVPEGYEIISEERTVIPSPGEHELYCYEFICKDESDKKCIIYVNAVSGNQERILLLLEDENGTLTL